MREIINIEDISFSVAKYDIVRFPRCSSPENVVFYAPEDMKFYKLYEDEYPIEFNNRILHKQVWIGITKYSEEAERISHNMHYDICGEKDNYPVISSHALTVYNIADKYLIWSLDNCTITDESDFPVTDKLLNFTEPIYLVKKAKSEDVEDKIIAGFWELNQHGADLSAEYMEEFMNKLWKPYMYIKVCGVSDKGTKCTCDCVKVIVSSSFFNYDDPLAIIERDSIDCIKLEEGGERFSKISFITEEEFNKVFNETLEKIQA